MSIKNKKILKNIEAKAKVSVVAVLMIAVAFSSILVFMPDITVKADGTIWVDKNFEGGTTGVEIPDITDWIDMGTTQVTFKYDNTTVLNGSTTALFNQDGDPGDYTDSFVSLDNFTAITEDFTFRFKTRLGGINQKAAIRFRNTAAIYDGIAWMWDEHGSIVWSDGATNYYYNSTGAGGSEDPATDIWYTDRNYTYNFQVNWSTQKYYVEYYDWAGGFSDYLCANNDGTGKWNDFEGTPSSLDNFTICGSSTSAIISIYFDDIQIVQGLYNLTDSFSNASGTSEDNSNFSVSGLDSNDRITWTGEAGETVWSNATSYGTLTIQTNINSTDNCTAIYLDIADLAGSVIDADNLTAVVKASDGAWAGATPIAIGSSPNYNLTIDEDSPSTWFRGTNPFPIDGESWTNVTLEVRFRCAISSSASAETYLNTSSSWNVKWRVIS